MNAVVVLRDVSVRFATDFGEVEAVDGASFEVRDGEILGLVGESGSGKSVTATAILRLIRKPGRLTGGSIMLGDRDLARLGEEELQKIRGTEIAMISQTPRSALNPLLTMAALSFIGLGIQPPQSELGSMTAEGAQFIVTGEWWLFLFPGLAIVLMVLSFNLIGDSLRDFLDPRMRGVR